MSSPNGDKKQKRMKWVVLSYSAGVGFPAECAVDEEAAKDYAIRYSKSIYARDRNHLEVTLEPMTSIDMKKLHERVH
jgi:hypothetical protein